MAVPFGFSVGDCIAVCILIKDAVTALDVRGASAEYQEVIRELWALDKALLEVEMLSRSCETTVEMNALSQTARRIAEQCRTCIEGFLEKIKGYDKTLKEDGLGNKWRDAKGKLGWSLLKKDELAKFRTEINTHSSSINMLLITASVSLARLTDRKMHERLDDTVRNLESSADKQKTILGQIKDGIEGAVRGLEVQSGICSSLIDRLNYLFALGAALKALMERIWSPNCHELQNISRSTDPYALGHVAPLHLELINTWEVFDAVLTARFTNVPGERKIKRKEYVIQNRTSQQDIERTLPFGVAFLPGQRIDMSMIFKQSHQSGTSCPGCKLKAEQDCSQTVTCMGCGMSFQRIEEIVERSPLPSIPSKTFPVQHNPTVSEQDMHHLVPSKKYNRASREESMALFRRVRLLYQKHVFAQPDLDNKMRYLDQLKSFHEQRGTRLDEAPVIGKRLVDLYRLKIIVEEEEDLKKNEIDSSLSTHLLARLENLYQIWLHPYEQYLVVSNPTNGLQNTIILGDIESVQQYLAEGADINFEDGQNAVQVAAFSGREEIINYLVEHGGDIRKSSARWSNALEAAVSGCKLHIVQKLVYEGMDIHMKCSNLDNLLQVASRAGADLIVLYLLDHGMDINQQGGFYGTSLIAAATQGNMSTCRILLEKGADVAINDKERGTALHAAITSAPYDLQIVRELLEAGADVNTPVPKYGSLLQAAAINTPVEIVNLLLDCGVDINAEGGFFGHPLQAWCYVANIEIVEHLLNLGAYVDGRGGEYETALIAAVHAGHPAIVLILLDHEAGVNIVSENHGAAFDVTLRMRHTKVAELLQTYNNARHDGKPISASISPEVHLPLSDSYRNGLTKGQMKNGLTSQLVDDELVDDDDPPWQHLLSSPEADRSYDLPCEFRFAGCKLRFPYWQHDTWLRHTLSHFCCRPLPTRLVCLYCDDEFFGNETLHTGTLKDPQKSWMDRMAHIGFHRASGAGDEQMRPYFFLIEYMAKNDLISKEDDYDAISFSTRDLCIQVQPELMQSEQSEQQSNSWLSSGQPTPTLATPRTYHHRESSLSSLGSEGPASPYNPTTSNLHVALSTDPLDVCYKLHDQSQYQENPPTPPDRPRRMRTSKMTSITTTLAS